VPEAANLTSANFPAFPIDRPTFPSREIPSAVHSDFFLIGRLASCTPNFVPLTPHGPPPPPIHDFSRSERNAINPPGRPLPTRHAQREPVSFSPRSLTFLAGLLFFFPLVQVLPNSYVWRHRSFSSNGGRLVPLQPDQLFSPAFPPIPHAGDGFSSHLRLSPAR